MVWYQGIQAFYQNYFLLYDKSQEKPGLFII